MIAYLKDRELRRRLSVVLRHLLGLGLLICVAAYAYADRFDIACFDLLLAMFVSPESWLPKPAE